jgi:hypothetical protein
VKNEIGIVFQLRNAKRAGAFLLAVMKMARPLKFKSVKELQSKIDEYFESCFETVVIKNKKGNPVFNEDGTAQTEKRLTRPFTITGLALHLNTTRDVLLDYEDREEFSNTIKKAKLRIENFAEEQLFGSKNTAGVIFNLVNNYSRWSNKQEVKNEMTTPPGGLDINIHNLTPEERRARINELIAKGGIGTPATVGVIRMFEQN